VRPPTYRGVSVLLKNTHTLLIFKFLISTKASLGFNNSISKYLLKVSGYNPTIEAASAKEPANATSPDFFIISYTQLTCLGNIFFL